MARGPLYPDADVEVLRRAANGQTEAFACLYRKYLQTVTNFLARRYKRELVEDLTQEVFLRAWKQSGSFRGDSSCQDVSARHRSERPLGGYPDGSAAIRRAMRQKLTLPKLPVL